MNSFKTYLQTIHPLSDEDFHYGVRYFKILDLKKGDFFVQQGKVCHRIGFVVSGTLRVFSSNEKGTESTTCFCTAHKMTSSYKSFSQREPSNFSIQAIENTQLLTITYEDLEHLYSTYNSWSVAGRKLLEKEFLMMEDYAVMLNRETVRENYKTLLEKAPDVLRVATLQEIATYLGVNRRTVTRIREELLNEK